MRRVASVWLAGLAACSFEPGTFTGMGGGDDAPVDAFVDPDPDNDQVLTGDDNCPTLANPDQRDHDKDERGDSCDLCPHLLELADVDGDGDGIGDSCDPRPALTGDKLELFDGFYDATGYATWEGSGSWAVAGGVLTQSSVAEEFAYTYPPAISLARHAVTAGVTVIAVGDAMSNAGPSVSVAGGVVGETQAYYCAVAARDDVRGHGYSFWQNQDELIYADQNALWPGTFGAGSTYTLWGRIVDAEHHCRVEQVGSPTLNIMQAHGPTPGVVMLAMERAAASFDYVFIVSVGSS